MLTVTMDIDDFANWYMEKKNRYEQTISLISGHEKKIKTENLIFRNNH